jgi:hypothetical protein
MSENTMNDLKDNLSSEGEPDMGAPDMKSEIDLFGDYEKKAFKLKALELLKNSEYMFLVLSLSMIYFVIAGIQFWMPDYG